MASDAKPIIAWDNKVAGATITAATEATGFPVENTQDWRAYLRWEGTGSAEAWIKIDAGVGNTFTATCLGFAGHNLNTIGATNVVLQYSNNDAAWTNCHTPFTPSDDTAQFVAFSTQTHRYFRLLIPTGYSAPPEIGIWFVGIYTQFEEYPLPGFDPDGRKIVAENAINQEGYLLGIAKKYIQRELPMPMGELGRTWVETNLEPMIDTHFPKPVFLVWDITNHPEDVFVVRSRDDRIRMPIRANMRRVDFTWIGVAE